MKRYQRQLVLEDLGLIGQQKLAQTRVLVIGAGGLGCPVLQYLAAAGVGNLGIVDFDTIEEQNLNRQTLYSIEDIGQKKALRAQTSILTFNPSIEVKAYDVLLDQDVALSLFPEYDIIVDATDHIPSRYVIDDVAYALGKPTVYGAIYKHEGQVAVFNYQGSPGYRCLFPIPPGEHQAPNCATTGVLGALAGIIGSMQAYEVIKLSLGSVDCLKGQIIHYHAHDLRITSMQIPINPSRPTPQEVFASFQPIVNH